jgi:hypothetical protein
MRFGGTLSHQHNPSITSLDSPRPPTGLASWKIAAKKGKFLINNRRFILSLKDKIKDELKL